MARQPTGLGVPRNGEIYLEFIPFGSSVRVVAVDAATGVEVSIAGPATTARGDLERVALRKLRRAIERAGQSKHH